MTHPNGIAQGTSYIKTTDNIRYIWVLGSKYEGCSILCERFVIWLFLFFQRKKERMTLSAIHPDGGENFRLYMGLLQHHSFAFFFFNFNKKWMIAGVQE